MNTNVTSAVARAITFLAAGTALTLPMLANEQHNPNNPEFPQVAFPGILHGAAAIDALGDNLPAVARAYGHRPEELGGLLRSDATLHVDEKAQLLYLDEPLAQG